MYLKFKNPDNFSGDYLNFTFFKNLQNIFYVYPGRLVTADEQNTYTR